MRRGHLDRAAAILTAAIQNPKRSPSQIFGYEGIAYDFLKPLITAGLVKVYGENKHRRLLLTDNGREFLKHYKILEQLFPPI